MSKASRWVEQLREHDEHVKARPQLIINGRIVCSVDNDGRLCTPTTFIEPEHAPEVGRWIIATFGETP